ncbi:MAG: signal peptidase I [Algicola sp.]|nr:signal peptidase I [Algicola sp.]
MSYKNTLKWLLIVPAMLLLPGSAYISASRPRRLLLYIAIMVVVTVGSVLSRIILTPTGLLAFVVCSLAIYACGLIDGCRVLKEKAALKPGRITLYGVVYLLILFLLIYFRATLLGLNIYSIPSNSMYPTFEKGDYILVDSWLNSIDLAHDDIIVFNKNKDIKTYVKRLVGLSGETVMIRKGVLWIDEVEKSQPWVKKSLNKTAISTTFKARTIKQGRVFVLGDNRDHSFDSRHFGSVYVKNIKGRVVMIFATHLP